MGSAAFEHQEPRLRADAWRNRERILAAARQAFVESGPEVPLDDIARRAGVGNATLYRHFPDRTTLIHHVFLSVMERIAGLADAAIAEEADAFAALRRFVHGAADERIGALCPVITKHVDMGDQELAAVRTRLEHIMEDLMGRARAAGQLRQDVASADVMIALGQLTRPLPGTGCAATDGFVHRHLDIFLDGLLAPARSVLPGSAASLADLRR